jgi:uncharacterized ion transporter superfamily protein YfcC
MATSTKLNKGIQMPDTYVIIFFVVLLAALLTYLIPLGTFEINYNIVDQNDNPIAVNAQNQFTVKGNTYTLDGNKVLDGKDEVVAEYKKRAVEYSKEDAFQFKLVKTFGDYVAEVDENGNKVRNGIKVFEKWGGMGITNYMFEGMVSGDKWGSAVGVVAFILIIGGAFGIILKTGAVEAGILNMIKKTKGAEILIIPVIFLLFSLGGAVFGMGEEAIPFAMILVPLVIAMGYDAITGIMITYVATQIGFATSWMNPFSVAIAQGIAGLAPMSGAAFRGVMFVFFTALGMAYTMYYAKKIKRDPLKSVAYESDAFYRNDFKEKQEINVKFSLGHGLVLLTMLLGVIWVIYGVAEYEFYLPEIATQFFIIGLVSGIIGVIFKLNNMSVNDIAYSFKDGAKDLVGAALVVGMAKGIVLVLGGSDPTVGSVLNTILNGMAKIVGSLPSAVSAWIMYVFQSVFNFFVVSGSGQAALTMPLMAPLAELVGLSKQVAVLAFQLGDGFTNLIVPTSACLMGVLGVARLDWAKWAKFQIKFQAILFLCASLFMIAAVLIGF